MIKKLLSPGSGDNTISISLLLLRIAAGAMMLTHGIGKFNRLTGGGPNKFADPIGIGVEASLFLAVFAEVFCAVFLIVGFATRLSSIPLTITMLVAAFIVHAEDGFGKQELPLMYITMYAVLLLMGAGKFSVDYYLFRKYRRE